MAPDTMDIDSDPVPSVATDIERKRKHKSKDSTSSKKRKQESNLLVSETAKEKKSKKKSKGQGKQTTASKKEVAVIPDSPYSLVTSTLYLPLSPISISPTHALASLLAEHLSPLLLTYYPPLKGVVLAYSNASISGEPPSSSSSPTSGQQDPNPQPLTLATTANEYGVLYVYLTATFLVFRPQRGQILEGWVNVQSEGFLGAVVLNLFSVGIERKRLPPTWQWVPPGEETGTDSDAVPSTKPGSDDDDDSDGLVSFNPDKEHFKPVPLASNENPLSDTLNLVPSSSLENPDAGATGYFQSVSGHQVRGTIRFRVVDVDVIPGSERDRGFLSIEGTMLSPEEEAKLVAEERSGVL
ncbi:hypothetical protein ASPZODRAFT_46098, partial [Penicilliopsis zonata CBS 506.65]